MIHVILAPQHELGSEAKNTDSIHLQTSNSLWKVLCWGIFKWFIDILHFASYFFPFPSHDWSDEDCGEKHLLLHINLLSHFVNHIMTRVIQHSIDVIIFQDLQIFSACLDLLHIVTQNCQNQLSKIDTSLWIGNLSLCLC